MFSKILRIIAVLAITGGPAAAKETSAAVAKATATRDAAKRAVLEAQVKLARARAAMAEANAALAEAKAEAAK